MPVFNKMVYNGTEYILGGGGNIGEPLNLTVTTSGLDATITWEDNEIGTIPPTTFQKSELVRKIGSAPTSPSDGDLVVTETVKDTYKVSGYVDQGLTDGTTYYYRVFSYSDLGGISYCDAVSVTPSSGWQPGVNTIAYFPLDTDLLDHSGNSFSVTVNGNVSIGTAGGVSAGNFTSLGDLVGSYTYNNTSLTALGWIYKTANPNADNASIFGYGVDNLGGPEPGLMYYNTNGPAWASNKPGVVVHDSDTNMSVTCVSMNNNQWYHFAFTYDVSTGLVTLYVNGGYNQSYTATISRTPDMLGMSRRADMDRSWIGYMSNVIFEDKCWTATEVSDYFDDTKSTYGIS